MSSSHDWGWSPERQQELDAHGEPGLVPGRVLRIDRDGALVATAAGEEKARIPGRLRNESPTVGDFVGVEPGDPPVVRVVLARRALFARQAAGRGTGRQAVAANVDIVFLVAGLDGDLNLRRLERYLVLAHESGARPVVLLNKADLCGDRERVAAEVATVARGVEVLFASAETGEGLDALRALLAPGVTAAFLGSSGVGKSSLVNRLLGEDVQPTRELRRKDQRGKHTTTARHLLPMPGGALLLDTPGMRELALLDAPAGLAATFDDIGSLTASCRFRDCAHATEPGCAVRAAIEEGALDPARWVSYQKLQREAAHAARRGDEAAARAQARAWNKMARSVQEGKKRRWD